MSDIQIRNFCIIAHIDHGKSTLADRLLQLTGAISQREMEAQFLDDMDLERERGITIKASAVTVFYTHPKTGQKYMYNLIDTPGHVDFHYEVAKALQACEGALLLCDATQGVQAQTVANAYAAIDQDLEIIPVINKVDLPSALPDDVAEEMEQVLGIDALMCAPISAKTGQGVDHLLELIAEKLPAPDGDENAPLQALIFDSKYDDYRGVIVYIRVIDGVLKVGDKIRMMGIGRTFQVSEIGKNTPKPQRVQSLTAGESGFVVAAIRSLKDVRVGDTVTLEIDPAPEALVGYKPPVQMVFCDFYPATSDAEDGSKNDFEALREGMEKLSLNDSSFTFMPVHSEALGFGFRCGFLGLLHMDIIQERLEREGGVEVVQTAPTVSYQVLVRGTLEALLRHKAEKTGVAGVPPTVIATEGQTPPDALGDAKAPVKPGMTLIEVHNPADLPDGSYIEDIREPIAKVDIILPREFIGPVMKLCLDRRGLYKQQQSVGETRDMVTFEIPLAEIIYDFFDKLKGMTSGYGTMDYEVIGYRADDLVKMDILVNGDPVEALSIIVHRDRAEYRGRLLVSKLREQIPRHQFEIPVQAAIGSKVIARETIKAFRKNVTAKCYGGDVSRKRKLLEKQKEGKKRMKAIGSVEIPQEAFMAVLDQGE
jgi:GTP-binding protein LepA